MFLSSYFWYKTSYLACAVFLVKTAVFPWFLSKTHTVTNISHIACVNMNSNCVIGGPHISGLHIRTKSDQSHLWSYYPRGACCAAARWERKRGPPDVMGRPTGRKSGLSFSAHRHSLVACSVKIIPLLGGLQTLGSQYLTFIARVAIIYALLYLNHTASTWFVSLSVTNLVNS